MQIRSIRVVYHHTLLGVLADRGIRIHAVAEWCRIPTKELCRLLEFGSPLGAEASERLVAWGTRMIEISKPETRATRLNRVGDESLSALATARSTTPARQLVDRSEEETHR